MELDRGQPSVKLFGDNGQTQIVLSVDEGERPRFSL
jgi:hypothetical protein